jgi:drug/metabolite transporter (DMT)-like permease
MTAVLAGLGAALAFTCTALLISRATTMIPALSVAAGAMVVGLVLVLPLVLWVGIPPGLSATSAQWLLLAGVANVVGFLFAYSALGIGKVGAITPIVSTEGAFAAIFAIIGGEHLSLAVALTLAVVAAGVILAATSSQSASATHAGSRRAIALALGAAPSFGLALYAVGRASADLPIVWVLLPARLMGTAFVALPLALRSRLIITRRAAPYVVGIAFFELLGLALYSDGSRDSLAVTAVLCAQFAAFATLAAAVLFHERLGRTQIAGLATIVAGVTALSALHP